MTRILGKGSWHNEQTVSECRNTEFWLSTYVLFLPIHQVLVTSNLEGTSSWYHTLVINGVFDSSESIPDGLLGLGNGVVIWTLDKDGAGERIFDSLNESVLVFAQY